MHRYLLLGQTGVGKSSFVNGVFGGMVAQVSHYEPCTKIVERYADTTTWGDICLVDTPGLSEDGRDTDVFYLTWVRRYLSVNEIDHVIYVTRLSENRFRPDEKRALQMITKMLGGARWMNAWCVLTFAGSVPAHKLEESWRERMRPIQDFIGELLGLDGQFAFSRVVMIDNVVQSWFVGAPPIGSILTAS